VLVDTDQHIRAAGGYLIQHMPYTEESEVVDFWKSAFSGRRGIADDRRRVHPERLLTEVLGGFDVEILEKRRVGYVCPCSRKRVEGALLSIGKEEMEKMTRDEKPIEVTCQFCDKIYAFSNAEMAQILKKSSARRKNPGEK
jgi:molecular chaperone Hsp33